MLLSMRACPGGCVMGVWLAALAAGFVGCVPEEGRRLQQQVARKQDWDWLASLVNLPDRDVLSSAGSWCEPGAVPSSSQTCAEVGDPQALWAALANLNIVDIHVTRSLFLNTSEIPSGWVNRTTDVRLLGAAPGLALKFDIPSWPKYTWLLVFGWLRFENLKVEGLMTMPIDVGAVSPGQVWVAQTPRGVFFPEVEARRKELDRELKSQGGFLTRFSGVVLVNVETEFSYSLGHILEAETLRDFFWSAQSLGIAIHWPALPAPAVMYRRKLVFMESFLQHLRLYNTTLKSFGNWPTGDIEEAPPHMGTLQESCQTVIGGIDGKDYVGDKSVAFDDSPCLRWDTVNLPGVTFSDVDENYCRNPADHAGAWCFTASPHLIDNSSMYKPPGFDEDFGEILEDMTGSRFPFTWKYCDIPECTANTSTSCQPSQGLGEQYVGEANTTAEGKPCQLWNQTSLYNRGSVMEPLCRNPGSAREGVWCWTDAGSGEWGFCDVSVCLDDDTESSGSLDLKGILIGSLITAVLLAMLGVVVFLVLSRLRRKRAKLAHIVAAPGYGDVRVIRGPRDSCTSVTAEGLFKATIAAAEQAGESHFDAPALDPNWVLSVTPTTHDGSTTHDRSTAMGDANGARERLSGGVPNGPSLANMPSILRTSPEASGAVRLDSKLGVGTFGQVWKCWWAGQEAACKIVDMKGLQASLRSQLAQSVEAVYMKGTVHPHLVRTLHVYQVLSHHSATVAGTSYSRPDDGLELWIIQELCNMGDLAAFSETSMHKAEDGRHYSAVLEILWEVHSALSFLHEQGIVHADLKMDNILLQESSSCAKGFVCKVGDFGVSHSLMGRDYYYSTSMSGEVRILAPEVLRSNRISAKMDTFSFGILMHELFCPPALTGLRDTFPVICTKTLGGERPVFPAGTPQAYVELAQQCWLDDPEERPSDASISLELQALRCQVGSTSISTESFS